MYQTAFQNTSSFQPGHFNWRGKSMHFWSLVFNKCNIWLLYLTLPIFQTFSFPTPLSWTLYFPQALWMLVCWWLYCRLLPTGKPRDELNLPSAVAIHQWKVALVPVYPTFSLSNVPTTPHPPSCVCGWNLPWEPHFCHVALGSNRVLLLWLLFISPPNLYISYGYSGSLLSTYNYGLLRKCPLS